MFGNVFKSGKLAQKKLNSLGMDALEAELFTGLSALGSKHNIDVAKLNREMPETATNDEKLALMKDRLKLFEIIQAYVGYYKIGTYVNPQGQEQPYYDLMGKRIYLGPKDFWGDKNILRGTGAMLHETLHVHLTKGKSDEITKFVFDEEHKPGFSHLMNVVEDIRINNIAEQTIEYGSDYIKFMYKQMYEKQVTEHFKGNVNDYLDNVEEGNKKFKKLAVNAILHYYGILKIGDKNLNSTEYELIEKVLARLEKLYPDDTKYLIEKMDSYIEKYGDYHKIEFTVRQAYEDFVKDVYEDIYLKYKEDFETKTDEEKFMEELGKMLGDMMNEMGQSKGQNGQQQGGGGGMTIKMPGKGQPGQGQPGQGGGEPGEGDGEGQPGQGSGSGQQSDQKKPGGGGGEGQEKGEQGKEKGEQPGGGGTDGGKDEDDKKNGKGSLKKNNTDEKGETKTKDKLSKKVEKEKGEGEGEGEDGESSLDKLMKAAQKQAEINDASGGQGRSLDQTLKEMSKEFNKDEYDRIRNSISYKITDFVTRFRKVLFEKKKNVTLRGLNNGTSINGRKLVNNVMETEIGSREMYDVLTGVFERRKAPGKIPNYYFGIAIDNSGSMGGDKMEEAIKTGVLMIEVFRALKIPFMLYSYDTSYIQIYNFQNGTMENAKKVVNIQPGGGTDELPVLNELESKLEKIYTRPGDRARTNKIIFIITDGESGRETTKKIELMKKKGYTVYGIGIGDGVREEAIKDIYGKNGIYCPDVSQLSKLVTEKIGELYMK